MKFKDALWDGSDPLYAPGISWKGRDPNRMTAWWKPTKKFKDAGYAVTPIKLDPPGRKDDEHQTQRAQRCRELTIEMLRWFEGIEETQKVDSNTWKYLIGRYRSDEYSPMNETKGNTRQGYVDQLVKVENVLGQSKISTTTFEMIKAIQKAMQEKGRSKDYINRFFSTLRRVARYGIVLGRDDATKVAAILSEMKFAKGKPRAVAPTREQVYAVIEQADLEGSQHFALGLMIQYEFGFRAVSVRGQWLPDDGKSGGIVRNGKRWQDGLTWDMFNADLTELEHTNSKTGEYLDQEHYYDLTSVPEIRKRLLALKPENPIGPVILARRSGGLPFTKDGWRHAWNRNRDNAGVPSNVWAMDLRAGAITEAGMIGADLVDTRNFAQHTDSKMTQRYLRNRTESANKVIALRQSNVRG